MKKPPNNGDACTWTPGCGGHIHVGSAVRIPGTEEFLAWCDTCAEVRAWQQAEPPPEKPKPRQESDRGHG